MKGGINQQTLTLIALLAVILGGGAIYLQYNSMTEAEAKMKALDEEVPDEAELTENLAKAEAQIGTLKTELTHLEMGVPQLAYIPTLLKEIETVGYSANMRVTGVRPVPPPPLPPGVEPERKAYEQIDIDVTAKGDYQAVITMVDLLRKFPKIVSVQSVNLTPKTEANSTRYAHLDTTMRLKAFVFPTPQEGTNANVEVAAKEGGNS
jgi:Tfp pilus assembly protein PilO